MTHKGDNCYTCTRAELLAAMQVGTLRRTKFGYLVHADGKELHPRADTVRKLKRDRVIECFDDGHEYFDAYRLTRKDQP